MKRAGITWKQWQAIQEEIIDAVYPIAYNEGARDESARAWSSTAPKGPQ